VVPPDTNILMVDLPRRSCPRSCARAAERACCVSPWSATRLRAVTHLDVDDAQVARAGAVLADAIDALEAELGPTTLPPTSSPPDVAASRPTTDPTRTTRPPSAPSPSPRRRASTRAPARPAAGVSEAGGPLGRVDHDRAGAPERAARQEAHAGTKPPPGKKPEFHALKPNGPNRTHPSRRPSRRTSAT
jgi:hypothetical protein